MSTSGENLTCAFPFHPLVNPRYLAYAVSAMILALGTSEMLHDDLLLLFCFLIVLYLAPLLLIWMIRKLLADFAHLHFESTTFRVDFRPFRIVFEVKNVHFWVVWWEKVGVKGGLDIPLKQIYRNIPYSTNTISDLFWFGSAPSVTMYSPRTPLERWDERTRLLLTSIGSVTCTFHVSGLLSKKDTEDSSLFVEVRDVRQYLPVDSDKIQEEQKILYPNGYPNFVKPVYELWLRLRFIIDPVAVYLSKRSTVHVNKIEIHGLPNVASKPSVTDTSDYDTDSEKTLMSGIRKVIKETRERMTTKAKPYRNAEDEKFLVVTIEEMTSFMNGAVISVRTGTVKVFKGKQYVLNNRSLALVEIGSTEAYLTLNGLEMDARNAKSTSSSYDDPRKIISVALAGDDVSMNIGLKVEMKSLAKPPFNLNSDYFALMVDYMKRNIVDNQNISGKAIFQPLVNIWWEDVGFGEWGAEFFGRMVSSVVATVGVPNGPLNASYEEEAILVW